MAEQKTDDQKPPVPHRGARPFAGPGAAPAAARPFLRPPAPNPRPAPFTRPVVPGRSALGSAQTPSPENATRAATASPAPTGATEPPAVAPSAPEPTQRPASTTPSFDISFGRWGVATPPVASPAQFDVASTVPEAAPETATWTSADAIGTPFADHLAPAVAPEPLPEPASAAAGPEPFVPERPVLSSRPITSEMVSLDALDAFDAVWGDSERRPAVPTPARGTPAIDHSSLGSGGDATQMWGDEIAGSGDTAMASAAESPIETARATPASALPAWLVDDSGAGAVAPSAPKVQQASDNDSLPEQAASLPWAEASVDGSWNASDWSDTTAAPASEPPSAAGHDAVESLGDHGEGAQAAASHTLEGRLADPAPLTSEGRVSAVLDRLAARVRGGEIDISSVPPNAPDTAVLASVLAALLGGSGSR